MEGCNKVLKVFYKNEYTDTTGNVLKIMGLLVSNLSFHNYLLNTSTVDVIGLSEGDFVSSINNQKGKEGFTEVIQPKKGVVLFGYVEGE